MSVDALLFKLNPDNGVSLYYRNNNRNLTEILWKLKR